MPTSHVSTATQGWCVWDSHCWASHGRAPGIQALAGVTRLPPCAMWKHSRNPQRQHTRSFQHPQTTGAPQSTLAEHANQPSLLCGWQVLKHMEFAHGRSALRVHCEMLPKLPSEYRSPIPQSTPRATHFVTCWRVRPVVRIRATLAASPGTGTMSSPARNTGAWATGKRGGPSGVGAHKSRGTRTTPGSVRYPRRGQRKRTVACLWGCIARYRPQTRGVDGACAACLARTPRPQALNLGN